MKKKLIIMGILFSCFCVKESMAQNQFIVEGINYQVLDETKVVVAKIDGFDYYGDIVIPEQVTTVDSNTYSVVGIKAGAFGHCVCLKSIKLPNTLEFIGTGAFSNCDNLKSITIPNSVTSIEGFAFSDCTKLAKILIPNNVEKITQQCFKGCTALTSVTFGTGVKQIEKGAFSNCTALVSVKIPANVESIKDDAFVGCSKLQTVSIANSNMKYTDYAFNKTPYFKAHSKRTNNSSPKKRKNTVVY